MSRIRSAAGAVVTLDAGVGPLDPGSIVYADASGNLTEKPTKLKFDAATDQILLGAGALENPAYSVVGDQNTGIYFPGADTVALVTGGVAGLRQDASQNVGIGAAPSFRFNVRAAGTASGSYERIAAFNKSDSDATGIAISSKAGAAIISADWRDAGAAVNLVLGGVTSGGVETGQLTLGSAGESGFGLAPTAGTKVEIAAANASGAKGLVVRASAHASPGRVLELVNSAGSTTIFFVGATGQVSTAGSGSGYVVPRRDTSAAAWTIYSPSGAFILNSETGGDRFSMADTGQLQIANRLLPGTDAGAMQTAAGIFAGTGAPNNANGANGDFYLRSDGGVLTAIYQKRAGAWVGVV